MLKNIDSAELEVVIKYLSMVDGQSESKDMQFPTDIFHLVELIRVAEFLQIEDLGVLLMKEITNNNEFLTFTNVRRHIVSRLSEP